MENYWTSLTFEVISDTSSESQNCDQSVTKICQEYRNIHKNIKKLNNPKHLISDSLLGKSLIFSFVFSFCAFYIR